MFNFDPFFPYNPHHAIHLPVSKSIGARYLVASFFAGTLQDCPEFTDCDDLKVIQKALLSILNKDILPGAETINLDIHASGTAFRFVTAVAASVPGRSFVVTGTPRLCARPMSPLLDVLRKAGAGIEGIGENGTGPYMVKGANLKGGDFEIRGDVSSQFISALMLAAPSWENGMRLRFTTPLVSRPYAEMTAEVMRKFGIEVCLSEDRVEVKQGVYTAPAGFKVEADWSAAGFFYEAAAFKLTQVNIAGLVSPEESLQGDAATAKFFEKLGVVSRFGEEGARIMRFEELPDYLEADLTDNPDLAPAFAVACVLNASRFKFTGVRNLRLKECDRLAAIQTEFKKLGYPIHVEDDSIEWEGYASPSPVDKPVIETYDDHRIAMAFAIAALRMPEMRIKCPEVVNKSFEDFWNQLPKLGLTCRKEGEIMIVKQENPD
ncbi:MAG: 3-phosphoshikimate 1-carboxyvinyltransferase [Muribaculaceae bacterium]|nr:3-phosphoshikimate 1-carboxyvinyltransferase [Muribaculaceae bacterium]